MQYIARFINKPDIDEKRDELHQAHLDFLAANKKDILAAGSLRLPDTDANIGGLWIVEAESPEQVREIYEQDPFFKAGIRETITVNRWCRAFTEKVEI